MQIDHWIASWREFVNPRFVFCEPTEQSASLERLAGEGFSARVLIARRTNGERVGFRTILVAQADSLHASGAALHWTADVRDALPEPATSDIYLFLDVASASLDDCLRLESDDQYCRKYVRRPSESGEEFLKRTFLAAPVYPRRVGDMADPLSASLMQAAKVHSWFSPEEQMHWRQALMSGVTGQELAARILEKVTGAGA
ncbi:ABC-three component system middle component 1 [Paraburkholderia tropica]|uniref:ABC-three component system middle component 1 n=1 Tax=Paraburkholderia tropica TaxID=92647 RepID=UPI0031D0D0DF